MIATINTELDLDSGVAWLAGERRSTLLCVARGMLGLSISFAAPIFYCVGLSSAYSNPADRRVGARESFDENPVLPHWCNRQSMLRPDFSIMVAELFLVHGGSL